MHKRFHNKCLQLSAIICLVALVVGCGIRSDIVELLTAQGIQISIVKSSPSALASRTRTAFVAMRSDVSVEAKIVEKFQLKEASGDLRSLSLIERVERDFAGEKFPAAKQLLCAMSSPVLHLNNGTQFDFLCLMTTQDGLSYLFTTYAYG